MLNSNVTACIDIMRPLFALFVMPLSRQSLKLDILNDAVHMIPAPEDRPDVYALQAELEVLFDNCDEAKSVSDIMIKACEMKDVLKLAFNFLRFVLTAGFCVASNERKFSKLKFVKNVLRTSMSDERLNALMILTSEKDLTDSCDLSDIVGSWAQLKQRRIRVRVQRSAQAEATADSDC